MTDSKPASSPETKPVGPGDQVILVDGSSFIFRAYFQSINQDQKYNSRPSDGLPTGAVRLFCTKIAQFLQDGAAGTMPTHLGIVFDKSEGSFRKEMFPDYKGHRPDAPDDLKRQMPLMRDAVRAFGLHAVELERYEADDLIATYTRQAEARGAGVIIVSSDKDLMQLVGPQVRFYDFESGAKGKPGYRPERNLDVEAIVAKWEGLQPNQIGDALALIGDTSDNVPGVPGIGLKTAAALIKEFGSLDALLERAGEIKQPKRRETLLANVDQAKLSRKLVALMEDVPVPVALDDLGVPQPDPEKLVGFLKAMEFNTLTRRIAQMLHVDPEAVKPDPALLPGARPQGSGNDAVPFFGDSVPPDPETAAAGAERLPGAAPPEGGEVDPFADLDLPDAPAKPRAPVEATPGNVVAARAAEAVAPFDTAAYETVASLEQLDAWISLSQEAGVIAVDTETDALDAHNAGLVGVSLAVATGRACYIPLAHVQAAKVQADATDLFGEGAASSDVVEPVPGQIPLKDAIARLKPLLEDPGVLKVGQNLKYDWVVLARYGIEVAPFDDTMLISYVLDAGKGGHGMDELARRHLGHQPITFSDVAGTGRNKVSFDRVAIDKATAYAAEDADVTLRLWRMMKPRLVAEHRVAVYETLERPLVPVIARMEQRGIRVDREMLSRLSGDFSQILVRLEEEIQEDAGEKFSVGSPKQIGDILFGKMGLPGAKKTPSGQWATPATLLEELAQAGHELPEKDPGVAAALEAEIHLHRFPPDACRPGDGAGPHLVLAGGHHHGPALIVGAEPPEHPDPHRGGPAHPPGLRGRARQPADLGGLFADRIAPPGPHGRHPGTPEGLRGRDRHPRGHGLRDVRRAAQGDDARSAAAGQDHQFRHHLRHFGLRAGRPPRHRPGGGVGVHQAVFRAVPRNPRLHRLHQEDLPRQGLCHDAVRPRLPLSADPLQQPVRARQRRAAGDQRADPGFGRRHHPPGHGADGGGPRRQALNARMLLQVHDELVFEVAEDEVETTIPVIAA